MENDEKGGRREGLDPTIAAQQHSMPTSSKRKSSRDDTLADTVAPPSKGRRFWPTPKTQKLYNDWRRLQDEECGLQQSLGRLPSTPVPPSRATTMPLPQPPLPATHSEVFGDLPQPAARLRFGRNGPLINSNALKTALIRELGACSDCLLRRIKVRGRRAVLSCGSGWC